MSVFKKLFSEIWQFRRLFIWSMVAGGVMSATSSLRAVYVRDLFNALETNSTPNLLPALYALLTVGLVAGVSRYFSSYMGQYLADLVTVNIRRKLQRKILRLNLSFHGKFEAGSGGLMSRIFNDVNQIQSGLHQFAVLFREPLQFIFLMGWLFYLDWRLTLILLASVPFVAQFSRQVARSLHKYNHLAQSEVESLTTNIKESLDGVRVIQSYNLEKEMEHRFDTTADAYLKARLIIQKRSEAASPVTEYFSMLIFSGLFLYITSEFSMLISMGDKMSFIIALLMASQPVTKIQDSFVKLQSALVSGERIYSIIESQSEVHEVSNPKEFPGDWKTIEYKNVSFKYDQKDVLKNFSLTVNRGEVIALVGESGSGKSTIVNLLERFYDPYEGQILVDGIPLGEFSLQSLRSHVALVTQDVFLFNESARYNIRTGNLELDDQPVESAAHAAFADSFIERRPKSYDFKVGDRGSALSGGEKQRLSIARAFYKNAPILILDEATSALDSASEVEVQKGLESLMSGRTVFVIAHRLSTVVQADKILVLKDGAVIEQGDHESLLAKKGEYYKFRNLQST